MKGCFKFSQTVSNAVNKLVELDILRQTENVRRSRVFAYEEYLGILRKDTAIYSKIEKLVDFPIMGVSSTANGYGDMVIMSMKMYEEKMFMLDVYRKLIAVEEQLTKGKVLDGDASLKSIREKYNV